MKYRLIAYVFGFFLLFGLFKILKFDFEYSDFKDYLNILLAISSMVFTLMGIWIAFIYPNALQRIAEPNKVEHADFTETLAETRRLEGLVGSVMRSALVVLAVMLLFLVKVIFSGFNLPIDLAILCKQGAISLVIVLSILQMESIFYVIYSNVLFVNELHNKREEREADADI
ncbi:hypothetical protein [Flocculibacter collagenilyticus]|uniref:hypothetical protein n=1 Tax=Flocculibacter collagenilyticus TaxID=2744479 RepID=UPI0018F6CEA7|nr:hypothetical protein [Flocculibacter collagenilyticus]